MDSLDHHNRSPLHIATECNRSGDKKEASTPAAVSESSGGFAFGAKSAAASGDAKPVAAAPSSGFSFVAGSGSGDKKEASTPAAPAALAAESSGSFAFGAKPAAAAPSSGFTFGAGSVDKKENKTEIAKYLQVMEFGFLMRPKEMADTEVKIAAKDESENKTSACQHCWKKGIKLFEETGNHLLKCSRCMTCTYCDRDCQVAHYKEHKTDCKRMAKVRLVNCQPGTEKGEKLIEFNEMHQEIHREIYSSMLDNLRVGNKSMDHVAVVTVDYNNSTNAFRIIEHELVPDKDIIPYFRGTSFLPEQYKNLNAVRKTLAMHIAQARTSGEGEGYTTMDKIIGFLRFKNGTEAFRTAETKVLMSMSLATVHQEKDLTTLNEEHHRRIRSIISTAEYKIHRINLLDPAYAKSPEAFEEAKRLYDSY